MRGWKVAAMLALSLSMPLAVSAQRSQAVELGFLTAFEDAVFLLGYRRTTGAPGRVGVDFSIGTLPEFFTEGFLVLPHLDLTAPIGVGSRAWLLPRAGVSAIVGVGGGGGGALPGVNVGIGLLGRLGESNNGVRLDVTYMRFIDADESAGITALTFGYAWIK